MTVAVDIGAFSSFPGVVIDSGVVNENIEMIVPLRYLSRRSFDTAPVGYIQGEGFDVTGSFNLCRCRPGLVRVARGEQHGKSSVCELPANFKPNAAVCPRD